MPRAAPPSHTNAHSHTETAPGALPQVPRNHLSFTLPVPLSSLPLGQTSEGTQENRRGLLQEDLCFPCWNTPVTPSLRRLKTLLGQEASGAPTLICSLQLTTLKVFLNTGCDLLSQFVWLEIQLSLIHSLWEVIKQLGLDFLEHQWHNQSSR